jgi:hypothetical protein
LQKRQLIAVVQDGVLPHNFPIDGERRIWAEDGKTRMPRCQFDKGGFRRRRLGQVEYKLRRPDRLAKGGKKKNANLHI